MRCAAPMKIRSLPELGAEVALAIDAREHVRHVASGFPLALEEHPLVWNEHVVEHRERLGQFVVG